MASIEATRTGFEASFEEADFYNRQTQDEKHLNDILTTIDIKPEMKILDLGCGSGYLTFPIATMNENATQIVRYEYKRQNPCTCFRIVCKHSS